MKLSSIYEVKSPNDHIDKLYAIIHLAKLGAAATDTALKLEHLLDAHLTLYETIHELASEGVVTAELDKAAKRSTAAETPDVGKAA